MFVHVLGFGMCSYIKADLSLVVIMFAFFKLIDSVLERDQVKAVVLVEVIQLKCLVGHFLFLLKHGKSVVFY